MNLIGVMYEIKNKGQVNERTLTNDPATNIFGKVIIGIIDETVLRFGESTPATEPTANPHKSEFPTVNAKTQSILVEGSLLSLLI